MTIDTTEAASVTKRNSGFIGLEEADSGFKGVRPRWNMGKINYKLGCEELRKEKHIQQNSE